MPTLQKDQAAIEARKLLQPMLAELIALALLSKQAHWNLQGPLFGPLHAFYDQLTDQVRLNYDDIAERMQALGVAADGRPRSVAEGSTQADFPQGAVSDVESVKLMLFRLEAASRRLREGLEKLGGLDLVTQDLVIGIIAGLEKQAWMLRSQVP